MINTLSIMQQADAQGENAHCVNVDKRTLHLMCQEIDANQGARDLALREVYDFVNAQGGKPQDDEDRAVNKVINKILDFIDEKLNG